MWNKIYFSNLFSKNVFFVFMSHVNSYILTAYNPVTNEQKGFKVTVLPITASDSSINNGNPFNLGFISNYLPT